MTWLGGFVLALWAGLMTFWGRFWVGGPWLGGGTRKPASSSPAEDSPLPQVGVIIPARNEAAFLEPVLKALLKQDYPVPPEIVVIDDESTDVTPQIVQNLMKKHDNLRLISGAPRPRGWSGKLWAMRQGELYFENRGTQDYLLFTDADILHAPDHLRHLVERAETDQLDLVSEMVLLDCRTWRDRYLIPAFVYFFAFLYPFRKVANPRSRIAGAAGGTVLLRRHRLRKIGGLTALREALIDDCTLAAHVKRSGGRLYLGMSRQAWSLRPYEGIGDIWRMITRTAYTQLRHSPFLLLGTLAGMALLWGAPFFLAVKGRGASRMIGLGAYGLSCVSFIPTLRWFGLKGGRAFSLPFLAWFYAAATLDSARRYYWGSGSEWHGRQYGKELGFRTLS